MKKIKVGVLVSGRGSNMEALIKATQQDDFPAQIELVLSDNQKAKALEKAKKWGIKTYYLTGKGSEWEQKAFSIIKEFRLDLICLAGFMQILSADFIKGLPMIMNIHPSLLPAFPGLNAPKQALDYGVKISGCTVHFVDQGVDTGPIILQSAVNVLSEDDQEQLANRILKKEHILYPQAVKLYAKGALKVKERQVIIIEEDMQK